MKRVIEYKLTIQAEDDELPRAVIDSIIDYANGFKVLSVEYDEPDKPSCHTKITYRYEEK